MEVGANSMLMKYKVSILQKWSQSVSQPIQYKFHIAKKKKKSAFPSKQSKPLVPSAFKPCFFDRHPRSPAHPATMSAVVRMTSPPTKTT